MKLVQSVKKKSAMPEDSPFHAPDRLDYPEPVKVILFASNCVLSIQSKSKFGTGQSRQASLKGAQPGITQQYTGFV